MGKWQHRFQFAKRTAILIGGIIIVLIALSNSITWHLEKFWGASGDFWVERWVSFYTFAGEDNFRIAFWSVALGTFLSYWIVGGFFLMCDVLGKPKWLLQYKVQGGQNNPPPTKKLLKCVTVVLFNQTVIALPALLLIAEVLLWRGSSFGRDLPTFKWFLVESVVFILIEEMGFYYSHRLFHHSRIYKHIHKIHHEWTAPIGIVTTYCHPLEHIMANIIPAFTGPFVMRSHMAVILLWAISAQTTAVVHHSGYHFPFLPSPQAHDYHHLKFNVNYGVLGILDWFHGTDYMFKDSTQNERHQFLLCLTPIHELIPDEKASGIKKQ